MTFVSYAQNFEDVMLFRALRHVEYGFYVDVGAYSAVQDSVTKAFYERGWRGVNIEPNPARIAEIASFRPRDINVGVAASDLKGLIELYVFSDAGLTTLERNVAQRHESSGLAASVIEVPSNTLTSILQQYVPIHQPIHFLKIDVEGHEFATLRGLDLINCRPWIMVIEATAPMSQEATHTEWEALVLNANYHFVYWDGLNRFYVADEWKNLDSAFNSPPNVFDGFMTASTFLAHESQKTAIIAQRTSEVALQESEIALREAKLREHVADALEKEISTLFEDAKSSVAALRQELDYLKNRSLWEKLLFRPTGKPKRALRRLLFHKSGKPRGIFRSVILHPDGRPHKPFLMYMTSSDYRSLRCATSSSAVFQTELTAKEIELSSMSPSAHRIMRGISAQRKKTNTPIGEK